MVSIDAFEKDKLESDSKVPILCVHDVYSYPTTEVELTCGFWQRRAQVALAPLTLLLIAYGIARGLQNLGVDLGCR